MTRRFIIHRIYDVRVPASYWTGPAFAGAGGLVGALALSLPHDAGHSLLVAAPSLGAGLVSYGLCLLLWLRLTGESLVPEGFVAGAPAQAAR
jgi:hypothetical protein